MAAIRAMLTDHAKGGRRLSSQDALPSVHVTIGVDPETGNLQAFADQWAGVRSRPLARAESGVGIVGSQRG